MPNSRIASLIVVLLTLASISIAQSKEKSSQFPQPPEQMLNLNKAISGKWATTYNFAPDKEHPNGYTAEGQEVWRPGPGGFTLMEEEQLGGGIFLLALHWWDSSTNSLRGMLCNNSGPAACNVDTYSNSTLTWDGKQLVIDLKFPEHDKQMLWHEVLSDFTPTSFLQTAEMGEIGKPLQRFATVRAKKIADINNDLDK